MPKVKCDDGAEIFFKVTGNGEPIVLIAGAFCDHHVWDEVIEKLSHKYKIIVYDNRGIGQSNITKGDYTVELLSDDLICLLKHLQIQTAHIIGHSMGGFVAQHFAACYPQKVLSLTLLSSLLEMNTTGYDYLTNIITKAEYEPIKLQKEMPEAAGRAQNIGSIIQQALLCKNYNARPYINKIEAPTLIISGINEPVVTRDETRVLASEIKNVKSVLLINCGHMLQRESPQEVTKEILNFLNFLNKDSEFSRNIFPKCL